MKRPAAALLGCIAVLLLIAVAGVATIPAVPTGTWRAMGSMAAARSGAAAVLLADHRVLITGGNNGTAAVNSAELFDTDGSFLVVNAMGIARSEHIAVAMLDGRAMVAGGVTAGGGATNSAEIYDPVSDTWTAIAGGMIEARSKATASLLADGRVLISGGQNGSTASATLEIFDPGTGQFNFAGTLSSPRMGLAAARLADGRVLITGGSNGSVPVATSDVFDPLTNTVSAGPAMTSPRVGHSATSLLDGRVLIAGGNNGSADLASAEVFDPALGGFASAASSLVVPRRDHAAILLPNNNAVLMVGGTSSGNELNTAEAFTPWNGTFAPTGSPALARQQAAVSSLHQDGLLLMAGGSSAGAALSSAELYGFATVKTDFADYPPGSMVTITGSGWQPGETVTLTLVESPLEDTHPVMTAVADGQGNIINSDFIPDDHDLNIRFYLTAVGNQSGYQAQNTFTDAKPNTVTVGAQTPTPVTPGSSSTYGITVNFNGNGSSCTSPLSVSTPLPTGATASFSPASVTSTGGNANSTLTISTTNATPPGSTTFTVLAGNGGGTCQAGTASSTATLNVQEPTTTTLTSGTNPTAFGQAALLTATVVQTAGPTTPNSGTVTFNDGAATLGTGTLNGSGVATLSVTSLAFGAHSLTASYAGSANFAASNSGTVSQQVNQASTTTALASSVNPSAVGQSVTFTATVTATAPGAGIPGGTVTFKDGATTLGTGTLNGSGVATFATSALTLGTHSITTVYTGNTNFAGSTSTILTQTVNQANTTTSLASSANPSVFGQSVTFTATVTGSGGGTPTGTVTFKDGATTLGSGTLNGSGVATFTTSTLTVATHSITAVYGGDANFTGSTSSILSQAVNQDSTTTDLTASPNPSVFGQAVSFIVTVTADAPGAGTPSGTVQIKMGNTVFGSGTLSGGQATVSIANLPVQTNGLKAFYAGDTNFSASQSQNAYNQVVNKASTTTSVVGSPSPSNYGQTVTFTATVAVVAPGAGTPAGTVNFYDGGTCAAPGPSLGSGTLSGTSPFQASASTAALDAAHSPHMVVACYAGDGNFLASTGSVSQTVNKALVTVTITASDKTYDGTNTATVSNCTISTGKVGTDDVGCTTSNATFASANANPSAQTVTATVTLTGTTAGNYTLGANTTATTTAKINAKSVTPSITADDKDYDTTNAATIHCTLAGVLSGDTANVSCTGTGTFADADAGQNKAVTSNNLALSGSASGNYTLSTTSASTTATIRKVDATVNVTGYNVVYNGAAHTASGTATGVGGANLSSFLNLSGTTHSDAGDYPADAWTFAGGANYNDKQGTVHDHIDKANATITVTPYSVTYDGDPHTATGTAKGIGGVDLSSSLNLAGTTHTSAGTYTDTWTFTGSTNYNDGTGTVSDAIAKADPVIAATGGTFPYDANPHGGSATATGVKGEALTPVNVAYTVVAAPPRNPGDLLTSAPVNAGNYAVAARYAGDANYNQKQSTTAAVVITKATPSVSVSFGGSPVTYDGNPHPATATVTGVGGADLTSGHGTVTVTHTPGPGAPVNAGSYTASAHFASSDGNYTDADSTTAASLTINKADPAVVAVGGTFTYDGNPHGGSATATGVNNEPLTPVNVVYKDSLGTLLAAAPVNAGSYSVAARYLGDANYNQKQSAAAPLVIDKAESTTTVTCPVNVTYSGSAQEPCTATVTGAGSLNQALTPSYSNNLNAGTATASATFAGDANHNGSSDSKNFTIDKAASVTTVLCPASVTYSGSAQEPCTASVTGAGGLNQALNVGYSNNVNAGTATANASFAGDANHTGSSDSKNFTIDKAASVTTVTCPASVTYTGSAQTPCSASVTGAGGLSEVLTVSYGNNTDAGTATANASFAGDANHTGSSDSKNFTIDKAASVTAVICPATVTYTGSAQTPCSASVSGAGGLNQALAPTYSNNIDAGTASASASYAGDANHTGSSDSKDFTIDKAASVTAVICPATATFTGAALTPCTATVTGAGGLSLTPTPTYTNNLNAGTATASVTYAGDANHTGSSDSKNFTIEKAASVTTLTCPANLPYTGAALTPCSASVTGAGGLNQPLSVTYANNVNAGTASANATYPGDGNHEGSNDAKTFTIDKAASTTTVTCPASVNYSSLPQTPCTATVTGAGGLSLTPTPTYGNNVNAGTASASYSYAGDANHTTSSDSKTFTINKAALTVKADNKSMVLHAALPGFTASYSGFKGSDNFANSVTGAPGLSAGATSASPVGTYAITAAAGSLAATNYSFLFVNGTLTISYSMSACLGDVGHTILQPINADGSSVFNGKSTSPAKFRVCDASGASIGTTGVVQSFVLYQTINGTTTSTVNEPVDSTTPDLNFRFDPSAQQWIFNINNKALSPNRTYVFMITLNDQSTIPFQYGLR